MPVTYNSSIGSQIAISSGAPEASDGYLVNQTSDTVAAMGDIAGQSQGGTAVSAVADATAFGTDTLSAVAGEVTVVDGGAATVTNVDLQALAAAQSSGDLAFASTYIEATHVGGDGSFIQVGHDYTALAVAGGETTAVSSSSLALVVIELDGGFQGAQGSALPQATSGDGGFPVMAVPDDGCGCLDGGGTDFGIDLDGNLATFDLGVFAAGDNSYADLVVDAFAAEDSMSTTTVFIVAAID